MSPRLIRLGAIATFAGAFSALFGVGGGTIIVPLLILWLGYEEREATGTSLAAIVLIAAMAAGAQGLYGNVDVAKAVLIGVPAIAGVVAGDLAGALAIGFAAGIVSGMVGVGGGVLFVPGLVLFLDESQLRAESTSL